MTIAKTVKRWVFWTHLILGLVAGIFIFLMSLTGFLLTYERQFIELDEMRYRVDVPQNQQRLSTDDIVDKLQALHPETPHIYVRWVNREGAAVPAWAGRDSYLFHPYSGEILREGEGNVALVFHWLTNLHRYLLLEGELKGIGKTVNGYANLVFIFLIVSGAYLWLPNKLRLASFKQHLWFRHHYTNRHHRRRQWHLVLGVWSIPVLFIIAITATLFHFSWANVALYGFFGEQVPPREQHEEVTSLSLDVVDYETLFLAAQNHANSNGYDDWYSMWMEIGEHEYEARFFIDKSIGHRQSMSYSLYFDTRSGEVTKVLRKEDWSRGGQAWGTARFLHTGEHFGFIGQTIAGLFSLLACYLVYTGFMLGIKRLKASK